MMLTGEINNWNGKYLVHTTAKLCLDARKVVYVYVMKILKRFKSTMDQYQVPTPDTHAVLIRPFPRLPFIPSF